MTQKTAPQKTVDEAPAADPREALLRQAFELAVPYLLLLGKGQKLQLRPGIELEMLSTGATGLCFMVDITSLEEVS